MQESYASKVYGREIDGVFVSGIQATTTAGVCAVLDLLGAGRLPRRGFVKQEDIRLSDVLFNRFGRTFARPEDTAATLAVAAE